jgi:hypothetical protein
LGEESDASARRRTVTALTRYHRRRREIPTLLALWEAELEQRILPRWQILERLAMIREWALREPHAALELTDRALEETDIPSAQISRLLQRRDRLQRKAGRTG